MPSPAPTILSLTSALESIAARHDTPVVVVRATHADITSFEHQDPCTFRDVYQRLERKRVTPGSPAARALQAWRLGAVLTERFTMPAVTEDVFRLVAREGC